jgi:hypothetical protein
MVKQRINGFEEFHIAPGVRPEVKIAIEIICDHVWDRLCPPFL